MIAQSTSLLRKVLLVSTLVLSIFSCSPVSAGSDLLRNPQQTEWVSHVEKRHDSNPIITVSRETSHPCTNDFQYHVFVNDRRVKTLLKSIYLAFIQHPVDTPFTDIFAPRRLLDSRFIS